MDLCIGKFERSKMVVAAAIGLCLLAGAMIVRGGGYGIGGLTWDTHLVITRSNLRLGGTTVLVGDRIRYLYLDGRREVHRDADLRAALRAVEADEIFIELSRPNWEIAVPLTVEAVGQGDLPAVLRGPFQVVAVDGRRIEGVMDVASMADWMRMNGGQPAIFTVSVPEEPIVGTAHRVRRPSPILPVVILVFTLGVVLLARIRARLEIMSRRRRHWNRMGLTLASGGVLLSFLAWHDGFLADPVLLPFALIALALWRPLSLWLHQGRNTEVSGPSARFARLALAILPAILLLAALYGWIRTLYPLWGYRPDGFVFDQLRLLVLLGAAMTVLYHLIEIGLHSARIKKLQMKETIREAPAWIGTIVGSLFIVTALVGLSSDPGRFLAGGWVPHMAGLVAVQWLGDIATLPLRTGSIPAMAEMGPRPDLSRQLLEAARLLDLHEPQFAVRFSNASVVLRLMGPDFHDDDIALSDTKLVPEPLDERVAGLLELLDAEGGMFPRHKTIRGAHEVIEDPFDGLDRAIGVQLALPLEPPGGADPNVPIRAYLISRRSTHNDSSLLPPSSEALEEWQQQFFSHREVWPSLRATAAEAALSLVKADAIEKSHPPADSDRVVADDVAPKASTGTIPASLPALLHDRQQFISSIYPIDEPDLVSTETLDTLKPFAESEGFMAIIGEFGSGREFTARRIHKMSKASGDFVRLDCSVIPTALVMAELTGEGDCPGRLAGARGGSIGIRDLSLLGPEVAAQVLDAVRQGSARAILIEGLNRADEGLRLIPPIRRAVDEAVLTWSPLRDQPDQIERAARFYLHRWAMSMSRVVTGFSDDAMAWLKRQEWPSNYHSLIACLRDAIMSCTGEIIDVKDLTERPSLAVVPEELEQQIEDMERSALLEALQQASGNKSQAARLLGMKRTTFIRKLAKYQIN